MLSYLLVFLFGAVTPSLLPLLLRKLSGNAPAELYDDSDAAVLNLEVDSHWFNMGWWSHRCVAHSL
jgi:hypothetical protein